MEKDGARDSAITPQGKHDGRRTIQVAINGHTELYKASSLVVWLDSILVYTNERSLTPLHLISRVQSCRRRRRLDQRSYLSKVITSPKGNDMILWSTYVVVHVHSTVQYATKVNCILNIL